MGRYLGHISTVSNMARFTWALAIKWMGIYMLILSLLSGLILAFIDIYWEISSLKQNIFKRICFITAGIYALWLVDKTYLHISSWPALYGLVVGTGFMCIHLFMAKGAKLRKGEVSKGLIYTSLLMYLLELPAEEFLYRGAIFVPLLKLVHPLAAILLTSAIFLWLHVKSWNNRFVWIGSFVLGLVCAASVYFTKSIWAAILIHNLNNFGFMTLVNKRNIFKAK